MHESSERCFGDTGMLRGQDSRKCELEKEMISHWASGLILKVRLRITQVQYSTGTRVKVWSWPNMWILHRRLKTQAQCVEIFCPLMPA